jgi:hypothetical protein
MQNAWSAPKQTDKITVEVGKRNEKGNLRDDQAHAGSSGEAGRRAGKSRSLVGISAAKGLTKSLIQQATETIS